MNLSTRQDWSQVKSIYTRELGQARLDERQELRDRIIRLVRELDSLTPAGLFPEFQTPIIERLWKHGMLDAQRHHSIVYQDDQE